MASAIFFSDIHLEDGHSAKTKKFIHFLENVASQFPQIFILGDLFDVWPKTNAFFKAHYAPVLHQLELLVKKGIRITYIEGNHDFNLADYFNSLGINTYPNFHSLQLDAKKILLLHGDLENPNEGGYRLFRRLVRSKPFNILLGNIPGKFLFKVSQAASLASRKLQMKRKKKPDPDRVKKIYYLSATEHFKKGFDVVVMGHIHLPEVKEIAYPGGKGIFVNSGDWISNFTFVTFENSQFLLKTYQ